VQGKLFAGARSVAQKGTAELRRLQLSSEGYSVALLAQCSSGKAVSETIDR
jgi:hypothetical protein